MAHEDHQVGLFHGRLPELHPVRQIARAQQVNFIDGKNLLGRSFQPDAEMGQPVQRDVFVAVLPAGAGHFLPGSAVGHLHDPRLELFHAGAEVDAEAGFSRFDFEVFPPPFEAVPDGRIVPVRNADGAGKMGGGGDFCFRRNVPGRFRQAGRGRQEQPDQPHQEENSPPFD